MAPEIISGVRFIEHRDSTSIACAHVMITVRMATPTLYMRRLLGNKAGVILTAFMELECVVGGRGIVLDEKVHFSKLDAVKGIRIRRRPFTPPGFSPLPNPRFHKPKTARGKGRKNHEFMDSI